VTILTSAITARGKVLKQDALSVAIDLHHLHVTCSVKAPPTKGPATIPTSVSPVPSIQEPKPTLTHLRCPDQNPRVQRTLLPLHTNRNYSQRSIHQSRNPQSSNRTTGNQRLAVRRKATYQAAELKHKDET
jgi:hypothetical protein